MIIGRYAPKMTKRSPSSCRTAGRVVMSPEQVAELLREAGHQVVIGEGTEGGGKSTKLVHWVRSPRLDSKDVSLAQLYDAANALRAAGGLAPIGVPTSKT